MKTRKIRLHPAQIPEWESEDLIASQLADVIEPVDNIEAEAILKSIRLSLPVDILSTSLDGQGERKKFPKKLDESLDIGKFNFYLIEVPLTILIPDHLALVRLRLQLDLQTKGEKKNDANPVVYDVFPQNESEEFVTSLGEFSLDVSKLLTFMFPSNLGEGLGFELKVPIKWKSSQFQIRTSGRMSNPLEWYVLDAAISKGFTGYAIIRSPKQLAYQISATLACEIRKAGPFGKLFKARYVSEERKYEIRNS